MLNKAISPGIFTGQRNRLKNLGESRQPGMTILNVVEGGAREASTPVAGSPEAARRGSSIAEDLFNTSASFKVFASQVSMHFTGAWRAWLFGELDRVLDPVDWDSDDGAPVFQSFRTYVRTSLVAMPQRYGSLGVTDDRRLFSAWYAGPDRLTVIYGSGDHVEFAVSAVTDGELDQVAGATTASRLLPVLGPYRPERWWSRP